MVARHTLDFVEFCVRDLGAMASMENPSASYLWSSLAFDPDIAFEDVIFTPCMFGASYKKPTRLRCWGWKPAVLDSICRTVGGVNSCGNLNHAVLEFGGASTAQAAAYHPEVCRWWAMEIREALEQIPTSTAVAGSATRHTHGRVLRHALRGPEQESAKEKREAEDQSSSAGMRNPADLEQRWPELWRVGEVLREFLLETRDMTPALRGLTDACGPTPSRPPPSEEVLGVVRAGLEKLFVVEAGTFERHHQASSWRYGLVEAVMKATNDSDEVLPVWLRQGAPMGLAEDIRVGGHFPVAPVDSAITVATLDKMPAKLENHPSWCELPSYDLLREQVEQGFAKLYVDADAAANALGAKVHPAPLGNVAKQKDDGTWKFRSIMDLRANMVNAAVRLPERQVLPRGLDHGRDMAKLNSNMEADETLATLVLDFKDAFMSIPLHENEHRFNCAHTGFDLRRRRAPLYPDEPEVGRFLVWHVLGFGGRPNPLVFSRAASFASRLAQAVVGAEPSPDERRLRRTAFGYLQLYVDDPTLVVRGTPAQIEATFDVVVLLWLLLGIPLSWKKGAVYNQDTTHRWIGIMYSIRPDGALMRLPPDFVEDLLKMLDLISKTTGSVGLAELDVIIGKAARVAHVVPAAKPFVAALWGALSGARSAIRNGVREAPQGRAPCRRFCYAAAWLRALLREDGSSPLVLERLVSPAPPPRASRSSWWAEFDASPYGGGAVLKDPEGTVVEHFSVIWDGSEATHLKVKIADPAFQSFWEFATLLLALLAWGDHFTTEALVILGDNTAALSNALNLKGRGCLLAVARDISWRQARRSWIFETGHIPGEHNTVADALSRTADPKGKGWPSVALASSTAVSPPRLCNVWLACPE